MHWDEIKDNWSHIAGRAKDQWDRLTDDDLTTIDGRREQLAGKIQERYGLAKDAAEKQLIDWEIKVHDLYLKKK